MGGGAHGTQEVRAGPGRRAPPHRPHPTPAVAKLRYLMDSAFRNSFLYFPGSCPQHLPGAGLVTSFGLEAYQTTDIL